MQQRGWKRRGIIGAAIEQAMEIIDLLSDNDDEEGDAYAKAASGSLSSAATKNDTQTDRQMNNNPYKNNNDQAAKKNAASTSRRSNGEENATENSAHTNEVHNPYKKKRKTSSTNNATQRKGQLKNDLVPSTRELQAGLVFEEDVDHIQHTSASSSVAKQGLKSSDKLGALKNDGEDDSDNDQLTKPTSAKEYAQHQLNTRIAHNLPPILYHDPDFIAGNPATIDG